MAQSSTQAAAQSKPPPPDPNLHLQAMWLGGVILTDPDSNWIGALAGQLLGMVIGAGVPQSSSPAVRLTVAASMLAGIKALDEQILPRLIGARFSRAGQHGMPDFLRSFCYSIVGGVALTGEAKNQVYEAVQNAAPDPT